MSYIIDGFKEALLLIFTLDREFLAIVSASFRFSLISTALAALTGVPFGVFLVQVRFFGRDALISVMETLLSLPTVVVGLLVYSFLSRNGPLGGMGLLFTPTAIVMGQFILIFPLVAALTVSAMRGLDPRVRPAVLSLGADRTQAFFMVLREARYGITAAVFAAFGRVFAEVGISMMAGGNIKGYTRTITTSMALETSKGEFALGIALGFVLLAAAFLMNFLFKQFRKRTAGGESGSDSGGEYA